MRDLLRAALLAPEEATARHVGGRESAVLVPLYLRHDEFHTVLTRRHPDLRNHAGEISFPGGRRASDSEHLVDTALREAEEEIGLSPAQVEIVGALTPISTFVTDFAVYPFVGLIEHDNIWIPHEPEVAEVLDLPLNQLRETQERRRLLRHGVPVKTDVYPVGKEVIWGATARILGDLLERIYR